MRNLIKDKLNGELVILLFAVTSIVYTIMLTITIPQVMSYSGGMKLLDMIPAGYDAAYVDALLNAIGEKGRDAYLFNQIPVDMVYPLFFGVSYCLIFAYILKKLEKVDSKLFYICFLPLLAGLFDYCENIGIITLLKSYPDNSKLLAQTTNVFSVLKSSFTTIYFILLISSLIVLGFKKLPVKDKSNR